MGKNQIKKYYRWFRLLSWAKASRSIFWMKQHGTIFCVDLSFESFGQRFALDEKSLGGKNRHFATQLLRLSPCDIFIFIFNSNLLF